jgi:drug/metabolite transporter (DMT)-like permease
MMASAAQMLAGGVALALVSLAVGERMAELPSLRPAMGFVYLTVFGSLVGYSAYAYLLREVRPAVATSYAYVNPIVAVALGALLAGERLSGIGLAALVTVLGGVALVLLGREHSR